MVAELDITDRDVTKIADMIDNEITNLVPEWKTGPRLEENPECTSASLCFNCASRGNFFDYASSNSPSAKKLQFLHCSRDGCAAIHGRFEEITYQVEGSENCTTDGPPAASSQSTGMHFTDIWAQRDEHEPGSDELRDIHCDKSHESSNQIKLKEDERTIIGDDQSNPNSKDTFPNEELECVSLDYENEIRQELRWLKAKYQMQLRELRDQQLVGTPKLAYTSPDPEESEELGKYGGVPKLPVTAQLKLRSNIHFLRLLSSKKQFLADAEKNKKFSAMASMVQDVDEANGANTPEEMVTANDFYLLPHSLHRATSLPVDAIDA